VAVGAPGFGKTLGGRTCSPGRVRLEANAELKGSDTIASDYFGYSVCVRARLPLWARRATPRDAGRAYLFSDSATGWKQVAD